MEEKQMMQTYIHIQSKIRHGKPITKVVVFLALFMVQTVSLFSLDVETYRQVFAENCAHADAWVRELTPMLREVMGDSVIDVGLAVVYPEMTRYSFLKNMAETTALEFSYITGGDADFSIGLFQMKPSFAKMLEDDADEQDRLCFPELFRNGINEQESRGLRIQRIKNRKRQIEYLALFLRLMERRFGIIDGEAAVRLFSAAYNTGFRKSQAEIEAAAKTYLFPYGIFYQEEQYSYTEIAIDFYRRQMEKKDRAHSKYAAGTYFK
jgi:hypothetical protein